MFVRSQINGSHGEYTMSDDIDRQAIAEMVELELEELIPHLTGELDLDVRIDPHDELYNFAILCGQLMDLVNGPHTVECMLKSLLLVKLCIAEELCSSLDYTELLYDLFIYRNQAVRVLRHEIGEEVFHFMKYDVENVIAALGTSPRESQLRSSHGEMTEGDDIDTVSVGYGLQGGGWAVNAKNRQHEARMSNSNTNRQQDITDHRCKYMYYECSDYWEGKCTYTTRAGLYVDKAHLEPNCKECRHNTKELCNVNRKAYENCPYLHEGEEPTTREVPDTIRHLVNFPNPSRRNDHIEARKQQLKDMRSGLLSKPQPAIMATQTQKREKTVNSNPSTVHSDVTSEVGSEELIFHVDTKEDGSEELIIVQPVASKAKEESCGGAVQRIEPKVEGNVQETFKVIRSQPQEKERVDDTCQEYDLYHQDWMPLEEGFEILNVLDRDDRRAFKVGFRSKKKVVLPVELVNHAVTQHIGFVPTAKTLDYIRHNLITKSIAPENMFQKEFNKYTLIKDLLERVKIQRADIVDELSRVVYQRHIIRKAMDVKYGNEKVSVPRGFLNWMALLCYTLGYSVYLLLTYPAQWSLKITSDLLALMQSPNKLSLLETFGRGLNDNLLLVSTIPIVLIFALSGTSLSSVCLLLILLVWQFLDYSTTRLILLGLLVIKELILNVEILLHMLRVLWRKCGNFAWWILLSVWLSMLLTKIILSVDCDKLRETAWWRRGTSEIEKVLTWLRNHSCGSASRRENNVELTGTSTPGSPVTLEQPQASEEGSLLLHSRTHGRNNPCVLSHPLVVQPVIRARYGTADSLPIVLMEMKEKHQHAPQNMFEARIQIQKTDAAALEREWEPIDESTIGTQNLST